MNFNLSEEQIMIQDSVARFVQDTYAFDKRNETVALQHGFSADKLAAVCGAGLAVHSLCRGLRRFWRRPGGYHGHHAGDLAEAWWRSLSYRQCCCLVGCWRPVPVRS